MRVVHYFIILYKNIKRLIYTLLFYEISKNETPVNSGLQGAGIKKIERSWDL